MCLFPTKTLNCWVSQHWSDKVKYIQMATYLYFLLTLVSVTPVREKSAPSSQVRAPHTAETCPSSECGGSDTERSASLTI